MARVKNIILLSVATLALAGCGGGGATSGLVMTPKPTPAPPPLPPPPLPAGAITIFPEPSTGEYASVGVTVNGPGLYSGWHDNPEAPFENISTADSDQPRIRYTDQGHYEVMLPSESWDRLVHSKYMSGDLTENTFFQPDRVAAGVASVSVSASRKKGYAYSELALWHTDVSRRTGAFAFGVPTPLGGVPITGSATYQGIAAGSTDVTVPDNLVGGYMRADVEGAVQLNFDFGRGTLGGSMSLSFSEWLGSTEIGTFVFKDTVFSSGSTTYSGRFDTSTTGPNFFLGRFTGPNAEETIGAWAVPFVFSRSGQFLKADGQTHQAIGAWIAKKN
jgi:hypothetical protein